jgi:hypothetical protein
MHPEGQAVPNLQKAGELVLQPQCDFQCFDRFPGGFLCLVKAVLAFIYQDITLTADVAVMTYHAGTGLSAAAAGVNFG